MGVESKKVMKFLHDYWSRKWVRRSVWSIGALIATFLIVTNILIQIQDVNALAKATPQPTIIYDRNGKIASKISASQAEGVKLKDVPPAMIQAVVSIEDQRFKSHSGVDYLGTLRATTINLGAGRTVQGGSTLTQQLAKNVFLTHERTYQRKLKEILLAKKIERTYSKNKIMEKYLNTIYFGEGAWGLTKAARTYFGKEPSRLTVSECATLAGLIRAPSSLSPVKHFNQAMERRDTVLRLMEEQSYLTAAQVKKAQKQEVVLNGQETDQYKGRYPSYVDAIIQEAIQRYNLTEKEVLNGGLRIYTELDPQMQKGAESVYKREELFPASVDGEMVQSGSVLVDPRTGGLRSLVGGRGKHVFRGFNYATQLKRQPGSSLKPLSVYAPAIAGGYKIDTPLKDEPMTFANNYAPKNYGGSYNGKVTMYEALIDSKNIPAVWLLDQLGIEKGIRFVKAAGIPLTEKDNRLSLALGGLDVGTSPLAMAQAYSAFPNNGVMIETHAIRKIENPEGETIAHWYKKATRLMKPAVAQQVTYMLQGAVREGTGKRAAVSGWPTAGKTGTTQLPDKTQQGSKDHWFVGYTPELVGAVWMGYDQTDEKRYLSTASGQTTAPIFRELMGEALKGKKASSFDLSTVKWKKPPRIGEEDDEKKDNPLDDLLDWGIQKGKEQLKEGLKNWFNG
ncbi:penicillin-binding protein 2A [Marininema mesophilum]|uniref:Penicillin-binding protein 2A n=1 Tax=Marininema mesophilum TaxID=1048340 RepID=A0A1H2VG02_9BACL|nr:PBP1A family penicillin-binding protein [Marininema mesophilum]SDW67257.1 penicillin-binding protein 2A [Marininema mesophilum]